MQQDFLFKNHGDIKVALVPSYKIGLLFIFPVMMAIHGIYWVSSGNSLALAVYAMKLAFIPFIFIATIIALPRIFEDKVFQLLILITIPCFALSLLAPLLIGSQLNFYYASDFLGLGLTVASISIFYFLFVRSLFTFRIVEETYALFLVIAAIYIISYYIFSGGDKLSITPEMSIPMAIVIGAYLVPIKDGYRPSPYLIALIAVACVLSQLRENLLIFAFVGVAALVRGLVLRELDRRAAIFIVITLLVSLLTPGTRELVGERLATMAPSHDRMIATNDQRVIATSDASINQRFVEIDLMFEEMKKAPVSFVIGKGFGATYENVDNVLIYYDQRVHNAHSTPFVVYFRNGLVGLLIFFIPAILAARGIISRDVFVFRASLSVLAIYAALLFNQYLYWNVQYGLVVALLLFSFKRRRSA